MQFLAIEKEIGEIPLNERNNLLKKEAEAVVSLYERGVLRHIYFNERHEAVIIFEHNSIAEVNESIASLPLVKKGYIKFEVMELNPYTGFSRLSSK